MEKSDERTPTQGTHKTQNTTTNRNMIIHKTIHQHFCNKQNRTQTQQTSIQGQSNKTKTTYE